MKQYRLLHLQIYKCSGRKDLNLHLRIHIKLQNVNYNARFVNYSSGKVQHVVDWEPSYNISIPCHRQQNKTILTRNRSAYLETCAGHFLEF